ncbi:AAA family ATPase, partial [Candidatus Falkowbacteria bacterium]|nr:AAA family ATPase [Candidatus Falkowbacteria bacterium]
MSLDKPYIICHACNGTGKQKFGLACPECHGRGVGLNERGHFLYWGLRLGQATIGLGFMRDKVNKLINIAALLVGLAGLISLGWWALQFGGVSLMETVNPFWAERHYLLLFFWIGVLALMFAFYRLSEEPALKSHIIKFKADEDPLPLADWQDALSHLISGQQVDVVQGYGLKAVAVVEKAFASAHQYDHAEVTPLHLAEAVLSDGVVASIFSRLFIDQARIMRKVKNQLDLLPKSQGSVLALGIAAREALIEGYLNAYALGQERVKPHNLLVPLLQTDQTFEEILYEQEIDQSKLDNTVQWFRINERLVEAYREYKQMARFKPATNMDKAYTAVATPLLNNFARDLTLAAKWFKLELCVARDKEIGAIFESFESGKNGVLLVGDVGVGKRAMIYGLAQLMVKESVPKYLQDKRLLELDVSRLISGANPAVAQERLLVCLDEISQAGNIILFINNIEAISGITSGGEQSMDLSDVLVSALNQRRLFCIATATRDNYLRTIEGRSMGNTMGKVMVDEPSSNQAVVILESKVGYLEGLYKVYFTYSALDEAVKLTSKYIHDRYLPK